MHHSNVLSANLIIKGNVYKTTSKNNYTNITNTSDFEQMHICTYVSSNKRGPFLVETSSKTKTYIYISLL